MPSQNIDLSGEGELLALASVDMRQAAAAARLLQTTLGTDVNAARALETAIAVCYWRPFSEQNRTGTLGKKPAQSVVERDSDRPTVLPCHRCPAP